MSSDGFRVKFDASSVTATRAALHRVKKYASGGAWNMLNRLTLFFLRSAIAATPTAKKKREIFRARTRDEMRAIGGWRYAVKFPYGFTGRGERMGGTMEGHWLGTNSMEIADDMAQITYWGAAKASWNGMRRKMQVNVPEKNPNLGRVLSQSNWVKFNRSPEKQSIVTVNRLKYLDAIGGTQIQRTALAKAKASLEHMEHKKTSIGLELAWRGGVAA